MPKLRLSVNGEAVSLQVPETRLLIELLREDLGLTGTKKACGSGDCGACTVLLDGKPVNSCLVLALEAEGKQVTTIEGLAPKGEIHPLQRAFIEGGAIQCGYCTPGMILTGKALLDKNPDPSETDVRRAIEGNVCRCTGYYKIIQAILHAARGKV
jgi:aerobic carbon-monoxide dehydrogenase small subunit